MNKVICSRLEFVHVNDIESMIGDSIILKPEKIFINLPLEENAVYSSQSQIQQAGKILNETVNARIKYNDSLQFIKSALKYYVIRLFTDSGSFLVGSLEYPAELTHSDDKIFADLNLSASKPL